MTFIRRYAALSWLCREDPGVVAAVPAGHRHQPTQHSKPQAGVQRSVGGVQHRGAPRMLAARVRLRNSGVASRGQAAVDMADLSRGLGRRGRWGDWVTTVLGSRAIPRAWCSMTSATSRSTKGLCGARLQQPQRVAERQGKAGVPHQERTRWQAYRYCSPTGHRPPRMCTGRPLFILAGEA